MNDESPSPAASAPGDTPADGAADGHYEVLARKYRPRDFGDLIGQQAMVRTLTNAFASGRIAHAFVLSGVRGVGKTTTARIVARALNCTGADGTGGPTISPCGVCDSCKAIAEDRHVDVLEMDAASRTGVDDIRELIEGVRYRPVSSRYKVYIIDEVHMLSRNAFNALLKTLEEPPEHVKFIFATTEIRRVPVTVLSRCQRFDLRRIELDDLAADFARIAELEGAQIAPAAIGLIARAADGSHRDGLSLLDQAIATGAQSGQPISEDDLREMLGLADRARGYDLLENVLKGDIAAALALLEEDYRDGADPIVALRDILEIVHWLTRVKAVPAAAARPGVAEIDQTRGASLTESLSMATLSRAWQMLLKGLQEAQSSPAPIQAVEMILIRLAYMSDLPSPADVVRDMTAGGGEDAGAPPAATQQLTPAGQASPATTSSAPVENNLPQAAQVGGTPPPVIQTIDPSPEPAPVAAPTPPPDPVSFDGIVELAEQVGAHVLRAQLINNVRIVKFEVGRIEINLEGDAPREIVNDLVKFLNDNTVRRWVVVLSQQAGSQTLQQQADAAVAARKVEVAGHPMVQAIFETFPGAEIESVRDIGRPTEDGSDVIIDPDSEENE